MKENNENKLEIICEKCNTENIILVSKDLKCKNCNNSLNNKRYKEFILSGTKILLVGAALGAVADSYINIQRPSVKTEYKMMKYCIDVNSNYGRHTSIVRDRCACAVESMAGIIDAQKARLMKENQIYNIVLDKYYSCS